jgi:parallel beta-helix repeat protein
MKRLALALLLLTAVAGAVVLLARAGVEATPGATVTVNSTEDTNARDGVITLREAMLLATGGLAVGDLNEFECYQVSNSTYNGSCSTTDTIGAASADTIIFDPFLFPSGDTTFLYITSTLPTLSTSGDTVDGSAAGVWVDGYGSAFDCFDITSDGNTIKGLWVFCWHGGIYIHSGAQGNTIGGVTAPGQCTGDCNDVTGQYFAVEISGTATSGNVVSGNLMAGFPCPTATVTPPAPTPTPTGHNAQVLIWQGAHNNTVGGTAPDRGNTIKRTCGDVGVRVDGAAATGNTIRGNSIHDNLGKGIELVNGGNTGLAAPIIHSVVGSVSGHTNPKCYPCTVEVFSDDENEGRTYHGSAATNDDATGTWSYPGAVTGPNVTATITDAGGNTSEFSAPVALSPPVGGLAKLPDASGSSGFNYTALAALGGLALLALTAGGWYVRRRWVR